MNLLCRKNCAADSGVTDHIIETSARLALFRDAWKLSTTFERRVCIRAHEYSNSCPHSTQTLYVRFLIVNTWLR